MSTHQHLVDAPIHAPGGVPVDALFGALFDAPAGAGIAAMRIRGSI